MAEKSLVNDVALMDAPPAVVGAEEPGAAVVAAGAAVVADVLDLELLHAASPAVVITATVRTLTRLSETLMLPPV
jgi:hypothetical protein